MHHFVRSAWSFTVTVLIAAICDASIGEIPAATIEEYHDPLLKCVARVSGDIEVGDRDKLAKVLRVIAERGEHPFFLHLSDIPEASERRSAQLSNELGYRICLNSSGGSFSEAVEIADDIAQVMGTAIERGAECLSACAIIFFAGSHETRSFRGAIPNRVLHAGGTLGVSAPSLVVRPGDYSAGDIEQAYRSAIVATAKLATEVESNIYPRRFLAWLLNTPPRELRYIDTVFDAVTWNVEVVGTTRPKASLEASAVNGCNNALYGVLENVEFSFGYGADDEVPEFETVETYRYDGRIIESELIGDYWTCRLTVDLKGTGESSYQNGDGLAELEFFPPVDLDWGVRPYMLFDPATKLGDIAID